MYVLQRMAFILLSLFPKALRGTIRKSGAPVDPKRHTAGELRRRVGRDYLNSCCGAGAAAGRVALIVRAISVRAKTVA